jgi:hypothetical protein
MACTPRLHWPLCGVLILVLAGCATSSSTKIPSLPQPKQPPSTPSLPGPPTTSPSAPQPEAKGKEKGGQGEASQKANEGEKGGKAEKGAENEKGNEAGEGKGAQEGQQAGSTEGTAGGSARTPDEQRDALDGQLQSSMSEFDGMLLEEQKALEEKQRNDPLPDRSGESSGGSGGGEGKGGEGQAGQAGGKDDRTAAEKRADAEAEAAEKRAKAEAAGQKTEDAGQAGAQTADTATGGSTDAGRLEGGTPVTAPVEGGPAGPGSDRPAVPPDVGDGKDDDVVARQLREAAMKEKDPAIREKLWEEYREYKKGTGKDGG